MRLMAVGSRLWAVSFWQRTQIEPINLNCLYITFEMNQVFCGNWTSWRNGLLAKVAKVTYSGNWSPAWAIPTEALSFAPGCPPPPLLP
jgi:hypothetical protein